MSDTIYQLRYMREEDIPQVVEIDQQSFPTPWKPRSYSFELNDNPTSHMVVLETAPIEPTPSGWLRWFRRFKPSSLATTIVGYCGAWIIDDESHISTIAVHPSYRGQNLGEALLNGLVQRSLALNATYCVLEVRVGNEPALALYKKYGFEAVGRRKNYYRDNHEDAFTMHVGPFDDGYRARLADLTQKLREQVTVNDLLAGRLPNRTKPTE